MPESSAVPAVREMLRALADTMPPPRRRVMPFGVPAIDAGLADGGLRLDALHEIAAATPALRDDAAATLFVAGIAARTWGPVLWVVRRRDLFAPRLGQSGLAAKRVIHAEAHDDAEVLVLMAEALRHPALGAVVGEVRRATTAATRRVQQAAEHGRTVALLIRRPARGGGDPLASGSAAVTRWRIGTVPVVGAVRPRWNVALAGQDGGDPIAATVAACDDIGRLSPVAVPGRQPRASPRTSARAAA